MTNPDEQPLLGSVGEGVPVPEDETAAAAAEPTEKPPVHDRADRTAGALAIGSASLLLIKATAEFLGGALPTDAALLPAWCTENATYLMIADECLVIGAALLVPLIPVIYKDCLRPAAATGRGGRRPWATFGCGLLAATVPLNLGLGLVHGRLVYPAYGLLPRDPPSVALVMSMYYGGVHEVALVTAAALAMLSLDSDGGSGPLGGRLVRGLGITAALGQAAASFPWLIGLEATLACQAALASWIALAGWHLGFSRGN
ncbi:hypothetical protein HK405_009727 [Cladochytrium tenue]|nr:hypothetical protein HK405_009727 [Cladochytrium tenue]